MRTVNRLAPLLLANVLLAALTVASCAARPDGQAAKPEGQAEAKPESQADKTRAEGSESAEITRERAIEIVRPQVKFEPLSIEAVAEEDEGRPVWRVTFRGRPPGPEHAIGEFQEFLVDRRTGEIVSLSMS